jgi:hypothetical protein
MEEAGSSETSIPFFGINLLTFRIILLPPASQQKTTYIIFRPDFLPQVHQTETKYRVAKGARGSVVS